MGLCCCGDKKAGMNVAIWGGAFIAIMIPLMSISKDKAERAEFEPASLISEPVVNEEEKKVSKDVLGYEIELIDGTKKSLEDFRGDVLMFVNVASKCGLTPQYKDLEALYLKYKDEGFVILGFPANEFGAQEPGSNAEIAEFCSNEYGVTFPMAAKIVVKGKGVHPLYAQLAAQPEPIGGEPEWNFAKFLVNRQGEVVARFPSRTEPKDMELVATVEVLLGED